MIWPKHGEMDQVEAFHPNACHDLEQRETIRLLRSGMTAEGRGFKYVSGMAHRKDGTFFWIDDLSTAPPTRLAIKIEVRVENA